MNNNEVVLKINALDNTKGAFRSLKNSIQAAEDQVKTVRGRLEALQPAFTRMSIVGGAAFAGVAFGIKNATQNAVALGESVNAVNVVFGDGADDILAFGENAAHSVGLANSEFNQMSTITGALLKDTGLEMGEVAEMTIDLTKRAADMASVFNTDVKDAMDAVNQAIRGETEAIRRYAGDVTDASLQTFLLAQGIDKSTTEMTEQEKRLYRVQLIMHQTAVTAGDFANTSDSLANQQRILASQFQDMSAKLGEQLIPVFQKVLTTVRPIIDRVAEWIEKNPELASKIILASAAVAGLVAVVGALGLALGPIILAFSVLLSPVGLVIAAIAALAAGVYYLTTRWQDFKELLFGIWETLPGFVQTGISAILSPIGMLIQTIQAVSSNWQSMVDTFRAGINDLITMAEVFGNSFVKAINTVIGAINSIDISIPSWVPGIGGRSLSFNIPEAPEIELPRLATGGIVTRPTIAEIGEAGPEAVIPLDRLPEIGGGTAHIYLHLDGREVADVVFSRLTGDLKRNVRLT